MNESPTGRRWATLAICCLASLLLGIDLTVLHLAVPALTEALAPSAGQLLWIADVYGFVLGGLLLTMGTVGDRIGRKRLLVIGLSAFGLFSLATAYAPNPELLIAARALLGVAGATVMPSTLSIIRQVFADPRERAAAIGLWSGTVTAGFAVGPLIGGALLAHFWWGSVFLINVPAAALIVLAGLRVLPESRNPRPARLDLLSIPLSVVGLVSTIYAITESIRGGPGRLPVIVAAVAGIGGLVLFGRRQARLAEPLIDFRQFRRAEFSMSVGGALVAMFGTTAISLIFAQYFQLVLGWTPLAAGAASLPGAIAAVAGGLAAAPLAAVWGRSRVVASGFGLIALGCLLYSTVETTARYELLLVPMVLFGFGTGLAVTVASDTVLASVPTERSGSAAAISETAFELGGASGIAVIGSVLSGVYHARLGAPDGLSGSTAVQVRESLGGALEAARSLPPDSAAAVSQAAKEAFVSGIEVATIACAAVAAGFGLIALVMLRRVTAPVGEVADA
ncbi:MFS transporter [Amycolatopsis panacis]|uniref:MFS transporter n=1 Tax=Amycolatopsis panacis TaxID=2340917 RepID=A0A419HWH1_9PSEU|nr:MFS transporter [Amycolatopsis panacis]RJQ81313.1 MFS transporter [Amycolatopsis panacis]